jgi:pyridoxal phosphate enzyme (YggS family)
MFGDLAANYQAVRERMARAAESVGRDPAALVLIAVSKTYPADAVRLLYDLGHRDFGESRLQEALPKIEGLPTDIRWHFIGPLQSNKVRRAASAFYALHTVCSESQLKELAKQDRTLNAFVEINVANEPQKAGIPPLALDEYLAKVLECPQARFQGLMTVGPATDDPESMRKWFRMLADFNRRAGGTSLSMGMSGDFDVAIQEGATHVRVGSALFGARPPIRNN